MSDTKLLPCPFCGQTTVEDAIECFKEMFKVKPSLADEVRGDLRGKDLMCFCPLDQPCHADVLLEIANAPEVQP